jgi:hypothetical protein
VSRILAGAARVPPFELSDGAWRRRFAAHDEDSLALAHAAAAPVAQGARALYVASTTWPRGAAQRLAESLDLARDVEVFAFGGEWRSGAAALRAAHPLLALLDLLDGGGLWVSIAEGVDSAIVEGRAPVTRVGARVRPVERRQWTASRSFREPDAFSSPALEARDAVFLHRLHGLKCECGSQTS